MKPRHSQRKFSNRRAWRGDLKYLRQTIEMNKPYSVRQAVLRQRPDAKRAEVELLLGRIATRFLDVSEPLAMRCAVLLGIWPHRFGRIRKEAAA